MSRSLLLSAFFFLLTISYKVTISAQTIGNFTTLQGAAQTQNLVLPSTHSFQRIIRSGEALSAGGSLGSNLDFTGFVPVNGSSTNGYLSISSETPIAECAILSVSFNQAAGLWQVTSGGKVDLSFNELGYTSAFCSGTVTPRNTIIVGEEVSINNDGNNDGYEDLGWLIEIDPVTRKVINQDGVGGADKLWAMGREKHENVVITPDMTTAYWGAEQSTSGFIYKFVALTPGNFSQGSLYVLETSSVLGTGTWKRVANTTQSERNNTPALAQAAGGYSFNRIEDVEIGPDGRIYFAATTAGCIYRFSDNGATISNLEIFVQKNAYDLDGAGPLTSVVFEWPDNLAFDGEGNLWVLQDGGNNYVWVVAPDHSTATPSLKIFANTPKGSEPTGITFTPDYKYLFLSLQHPASANKTAQADASGDSVVFNTNTTLVIARNESFGNPLQLSVGSLNMPFCANSVTRVPFVASGYYNPGNYFTAELSDVAGSFATPVVLGTSSGNNSIIFGSVPSTVTPAAGYKLRIKSSDPVITSSPAEALTINPQASISMSVQKTTAAACQDDATLKLVTTGGSAPFAYFINQGEFQSGNLFAFLPPATYTANAVDAKGCSKTISNIVVTRSSPLVVKAAKTTAAFCLDDATITLTGSGGNAPYTFSLDGSTFTVANKFSGLAPGNYTGYVKDARACLSSIGIAVTRAAALVLKASKTMAALCIDDGSITLSASGGNAPYTYSLDGSTFTVDKKFGGLAEGTYTGYAKDAKECMASLNVSVLRASPFVIKASKTVAAACLDDGTITLSVTGGISPYTYSLDGITYVTNKKFTRLPAGTYTAYVQDARSCTGTLTGIVVSKAAVLIATVKSKTNASSCSSADGKIVLGVTGGTSPYVYSLDDVNYSSISTFTGLARGTYTGFVRDARGCKSPVDVSLGPENCPVQRLAIKDSFSIKGEAVSAISLYPVPVSKRLFINYTSANTTIAGINVFNSSGISVYAGRKAMVKGINKFHLDVEYLPAGLYIFMVIDNRSTTYRRFIKK